MNTYERLNELPPQKKAAFIIITVIVLVALISVIVVLCRPEQPAPPVVEPPAASSSESIPPQEGAVMPDVVGLNAGDAFNLIRSANKDVDDIVLMRANGAELLFFADFVVSEQTPAEGTPLTSDTHVVLICLSPEELQQM